jgi:hypothetical protein
VINPATLQMVCDAVDDAGGLVAFVLLLILVSTVTILGGSLFLALAIRAAGRAIIRRFVSGKI